MNFACVAVHFLKVGISYERESTRPHALWTFCCSNHIYNCTIHTRKVNSIQQTSPSTSICFCFFRLVPSFTKMPLQWPESIDGYVHLVTIVNSQLNYMLMFIDFHHTVTQTHQCSISIDVRKTTIAILYLRSYRPSCTSVRRTKSRSCSMLTR